MDQKSCISLSTAIYQLIHIHVSFGGKGCTNRSKQTYQLLVINVSIHQNRRLTWVKSKYQSTEIEDFRFSCFSVCVLFELFGFSLSVCSNRLIFLFFAFLCLVFRSSCTTVTLLLAFCCSACAVFVFMPIFPANHTLRVLSPLYCLEPGYGTSHVFRNVKTGHCSVTRSFL